MSLSKIFGIGFLGIVAALLVPPSSGFVFGNLFENIIHHKQLEVRQDLFQVTEKQQDRQLRFDLHIGYGEDPQMAISNMVVELHHESADSYDHVLLPGADGSHSHLSSGHRRLDLITPGRYVSLHGTQHVRLEKACWEMCWQKNRPSGTLVCGLQVPHDYKRNAAVLPKGQVYLSFHVWTNEGLAYGQEEKRKLEVELQKCLAERNEALEQVDLTDNPIMKALHIRNAFAAAERYSDADHHTLDIIPTSSEVVPLQDDLLLSKKGLIYYKEDPTQAGHEFLGFATVSLETSSKKTKDRLSRLAP